MSDWPPDFDEAELDEDDIDMGEPVTDKLNVLLEELHADWAAEDGDADMGEPVTDKLNALLAQLPDDWDSEETEIDLVDPVTGKLNELLTEPIGEGFWPRVRRSAEWHRLSAGVSKWSPRGLALLVREFAKALFGSSQE